MSGEGRITSATAVAYDFSDGADAVEQARNALHDEANGFRSHAERIATDDSLSPQGRQEAVTQAQAAAWERVSGHAETLTSSIGSLRERLHAHLYADPPADRDLARVRELLDGGVAVAEIIERASELRRPETLRALREELLWRRKAKAGSTLASIAPPPADALDAVDAALIELERDETLRNALRRAKALSREDTRGVAMKFAHNAVYGGGSSLAASRLALGYAKSEAERAAAGGRLPAA